MGRSDDVDGSGRASFPELMLGRFAFAVFGGDFKRPNLVPVVKRQADHKVILLAPCGLQPSSDRQQL